MGAFLEDHGSIMGASWEHQEAAEPQILGLKSGGSAALGKEVADLEQSLHSENARSQSEQWFPCQYGRLTFSEQNYFNILIFIIANL